MAPAPTARYQTAAEAAGVGALRGPAPAPPAGVAGCRAGPVRGGLDGGGPPPFAPRAAPRDNAAPPAPLTLPDPVELAGRPSTADALDRANLSRAALAWAGDGDPTKAPPELVAVLGGARFRLPEPAYSVALSPDGKVVAASSGSNIVLFDAADGAYRRTLLGHTEKVNRLAFNPDGDLLASSSLDGTVRLWKVADGREQRTLGGHTEA